MPEGQVLEFNRVTKRFGAVTAIADLSVRVEPGVVTGFLGPNGAGKTTSLRMMLGQIRPTSGTVTIGGVPYSDLRNPLRTVGAVLEEAAYRPRRTASRQLAISAKANGIPSSRIDEVLRLVGLQEDADTRLGSYSLGMRQRLAVASALLGDPGVLVLDEPANGLDPEGIRWMRLLMRRLADEGRTVLVSSHVLSEIEQVADSVVVLSKGHAVFSGPIDQLADPDGGAVIVDAANRAQLITALSAAKLNFDVLRSGVTVRDSDAATVGAITTAASVPLTLLQQRGPSLEDVFLDLVYGRRSDSPRLDEVANPVAHASEQGTVAAPSETPAPEEARETDEPEADAAETSAPDAGATAEASAAAGAATGGVTTTEAAADAGTFADETAPTADSTQADSEVSSEPGPGIGPGHDGEPRAESGDDTESGDDGGPATESSVVDEPDGADSPSAPEQSAEVEHPRRADRRSLRGAAFGLWDTRPTPAVPAATAPEASDTENAPEATGPETAPAAAQTDGDRTDGDRTDGDRPGGDQPVAREHAEDEAAESGIVLPLATEAVSIPAAADATTFTELITGIPASAAPDTAEPTSPATEAISVFAPLLSDNDDDDSAVDDAEDDPRLAAMRTSLSSAASRFFGGPAPDYPYGTAPVQDASPARDEQSTPTGEVTPEDGSTDADGSGGSKDAEDAAEDAAQQPGAQAGDENRD